MERLPRRLVPPSERGRYSVARASGAWYVAARSREIGRRPIAKELLGTPLAVFRGGDGRAAALLDRCPHRNVPLSLGRVVGSGHLECAYHGWQFDGHGHCRCVPGLDGRHDIAGRRVPAYPTRERDGLVWVWGDSGSEPAGEPFALEQVRWPGYTTVVRTVDVEGTLHAAAENALDVPHTAYLHRGLFRGGEKNRITAIVRRTADRVEAEYRGEPRPGGILGRLLSPSGGLVEHWDRFILPSVVQVEYRLGTENHLLVTSLLTPVSDFRTRMVAAISFRVRLPGWLLRLLLEPFARALFRQDAAILRSQTKGVRAFGGERFRSTTLDVLGPGIWRLLQGMESGGAAEDEPAERRIEILV